MTQQSVITVRGFRATLDGFVWSCDDKLTLRYVKSASDRIMHGMEASEPQPHRKLVLGVAKLTRGKVVMVADETKATPKRVY